MNICILCAACGVVLGFGLGILLVTSRGTHTDDTEPVYLTDSMIDALNRDEPRRPHIGYKDTSSNLKVWYCPRCFHELCREDDAGKVLYCPECGQRIDWSDAYR